MHKGAILTLDKGKVPPKDLLERVILNNLSCKGIALVDPEGLTVVKEADTADLDGLMETLEVYKEHRRLLYLGSFPDVFSEDDVQPFVLAEDGNGNPLICCCLEGDYDEYAPKDAKDGEHSFEFYAVNTYLKPKLAEIIEDVDGDIDKLWKKLHSPTFAKEMQNLAAGSHTLIFMTSADEFLDFSKDTYGTKFDWGFASDTFEPKKTEAKVEEPQAEAEKPLTMAEKLKAKFGKKTETSPAPPQATATPPAQPPKTAEPKTATALPKDVPTGGVEMGKCPANLTKRDDILQWHRDHNDDIDPKTNVGRIPPNWKDKPMIRLRKKPAVAKSFQEAEKQLKQVAESTATKHPTVPLIPIIAPEDKEVMKRLLAPGGGLASLIDASRQKFDYDPEKLAEMEKKNPSFFTLMPELKGMFLTYDDLVTMGRAVPDTLAAFAFHMQLSTCLFAAGKTPEGLEKPTATEESAKKRIKL